MNYPGEGLLGILATFGFGRMFTELPKAMQWKALNDRVNWTGLTATEKDEVMARALEDMTRKSSGGDIPRHMV